MNKADKINLQRYHFAWTNNTIADRKRLKIQLTACREQEPKETRRYKNRLRRFLVRLRSD